MYPYPDAPLVLRWNGREVADLVEPKRLVLDTVFATIVPRPEFEALRVTLEEAWRAWRGQTECRAASRSTMEAWAHAQRLTSAPTLDVATTAGERIDAKLDWFCFDLPRNRLSFELLDYPENT